MWLNLIFGILEIFIMAVGLYYFMSHISHEIAGKKSCNIAAFAGYVLIVFVSLFMDQYVWSRFFSIVIPLAYGLCVGYRCFSKQKTYLCYCGIYMICIWCCQSMISAGIMEWYMKRNIVFTYGAGNMTILVKCLAVIFLTKILTSLVKRGENREVSSRKYWGIFLLPVFSFLFLHSLISMGNIYIQFYGAALIVINAAALLFLNIYIIYLFYNVGRAVKLEKDLELLEQKSEMQFRYYEELEEKYRSSRKLIHDMRNHLHAIEELYGSEEKEAKAYVKDLHQMLNTMGQKYYTDNRMLNIILNDKIRRAEKEGVEVEVKIGAIDLQSMRDIDITTIFSNLLDNAIEAAATAETKKWVEIRADRFHDFHIIKMTNTKGVERKKEGHMGVGLENIRNALGKYEGKMEVKEEENDYRVVITIPQI